MKRRLAYQGRSIAVYVEEAELPGGRRVDLDVVRHPGASAIVPFETDDVVLLIRQYRHAADGSMILEVPAGKLDDGETPEVCVRRELQEEAGQRAGRIESLGWIWTTPGFTDEKIYLFADFDLTPVPRLLDDDVVIELVPTSLSRALDMVWRGEINDDKSALSLLHAARRAGRLR